MTENGLYRLPIRTRKLKIGGDYQGIEITLHTNPAMGAYMGALDAIQQDSDPIGSRVRHLAEFLVGVVREWNVASAEGEPIPLTLEGMLLLPQDLIIEVMTRAIEAISAAPLAINAT